MAHKDPKDRAHLWQRPQRPDEAPPAAAPDSAYPYELPRHVHKADGIWKQVDTPADCDAALADGWALLPPPPAPVSEAAPVNPLAAMTDKQ